jgi:hypothetical protein
LNKFKARLEDPQQTTGLHQRNKFISRHILTTTGKTRTIKQIGSRIQQLGKYGSPDIQRLVSYRYTGSSRPNADYLSPHHSHSRSLSHNPQILNLPTPALRRLQDSWVDILTNCGETARSPDPPHINIRRYPLASPIWTLELESLLRTSPPSSSNNTTQSTTPHAIIRSPLPLATQTVTTIYRKDLNIHQEKTSMFCCGPSRNADWIYIAPLVQPITWASLCQKDKTEYILVQRLSPLKHGVSPVSISYSFLQPPACAPPSPATYSRVDATPQTNTGSATG